MIDIIDEISKRYWAMRPRDRLGAAVKDVFRRYQSELQAKGWAERIGSSWLRYHGYDADGGPATSSDVIPGGEQGELDLTQANHYRSLIRSMLGLATSSRPAFSASATDDSADSMAACHLAEQVWEFELERGLESVAREGGERMLVESECGVLLTWAAEAGEVVGAQDVYDLDEAGQPIMEDAVVGEEPDPVTGEMQPVMGQRPRVIDQKPLHAGDLVYEALGPLDVARDLQARNRRDLTWVIVRRVMGKWDLVAQYEDEESLREISSADGPPRNSSEGNDGSAGAGDGNDQCYILELYHKSTPAVPGGRYARVVGEYVLEEGPLPGTRIPVILKSPSCVIGKPVGYTDAWDLLGLAKLYDACITNMATTANRGAQGQVLLPEGSDINPAHLTGPGVIDVKVDSATGRMIEPKWMEGPTIPETQLKWADLLRGEMQILSGVNSVVRGDPEASLKSGAALALVQAMAVQHNSAFQASYAELLRDLATLVIDLYRENAHAERTIDIVGDDEIGTVRAFTGDALSKVRRVRAELANPLMRTIAGKKELADFYADPTKWPADQPLTRAQHMAFITSGRLDNILRSSRSEAIGIKAENEALSRNEPIMAAVSDTHEMHMREHKALLDGKQRSQLSPETIVAIGAHIQEHEAQWLFVTQARPALLVATGQRPCPVAAPPMGPPGPGGPPPGPGGPGGPGAPDAGGGELPIGPPSGGAMGEPAIPGTGPTAADMPRAPMNPATGQRAQLPDGAMQ